MISPLFKLPNEILQKIGQNFLVFQHDSSIADCSQLAVLLLTCRRLCSSLQPLLFCRVRLSSRAQVASLWAAPSSLILHVREIVVCLDSPCLRSWAVCPHSTGPETFATTEQLATVISRAVNLSSLSFRIHECHDFNSLWRVICSSPGLSVSFEPLRAFQPEGALSELAELYIDGFEDIGPFLRQCPNLRCLRLVSSGGLRMLKVRGVVETLGLFPNLRSLTICPNFLDGEGCLVNLMEEIGKALCRLGSLSLQTRWLGYGVSMVSLAASDIQDVINAIKHLPNLTQLHLPYNMLTPAENSLFQRWRQRATYHASNSTITSMIEIERKNALARAEKMEFEAIQYMRAFAPRLSDVSWTRYAHVHLCERAHRGESVVLYRFHHLDVDIRAPQVSSTGVPMICPISATERTQASRRLRISTSDGTETQQEALITIQDAEFGFEYERHHSTYQSLSNVPLVVTDKTETGRMRLWKVRPARLIGCIFTIPILLYWLSGIACVISTATK